MTSHAGFGQSGPDKKHKRVHVGAFVSPALLCEPEKAKCEAGMIFELLNWTLTALIWKVRFEVLVISANFKFSLTENSQVLNFAYIGFCFPPSKLLVAQIFDLWKCFRPISGGMLP